MPCEIVRRKQVHQKISPSPSLESGMILLCTAHHMMSGEAPMMMIHFGARRMLGGYSKFLETTSTMLYMAHDASRRDKNALLVHFRKQHVNALASTKMQLWREKIHQCLNGTCLMVVLRELL